MEDLNLRRYSAAAMLTGFLAADGFLDEVNALVSTTMTVRSTHGRLVLAESADGEPIQNIPWTANTWYDVQELQPSSIKDAATQLKAKQRNWALYSSSLHRRAALIASHLPPVSAKPLVFPAPAPSAPLGSWTLTEAGTVLAAQRCSSPFPHGEPQFVEDRTGPPNRAYLKLWEALTVAGVRPGPGDRCIDLGASPGGWTWVAASLGAQVLAIDKAPLAPEVAALPNVSVRQMSAFALNPRDEPCDWLLSDVVCYPARLLRLVEQWLAAGAARRFICTLKFQGETDHAAVAAFAALPGRLVHLHHNKHELTWLHV